MLPAFKQYLSTLKLSPVSRKLYSLDVQKFLHWLPSETLSEVTSPQIYSKYLASLRSQATAPSMLKRTLASLRQFGTFLSLTYSIPNPALLHRPLTIDHRPLTKDYLTHFTNYLISDHLSPLTIKSYKSDITRYLDWANKHLPRTEIREVLSDKNIKKYLNHLLQSGSIISSTIDRKEQSLARFRSWYIKIYAPAYVTDNVPSHPASPTSPTRVWSLASIISFGILILFIATLGIFGYRQFSRDATLTSAYPSTPVTPNRQLSFQGRLENAGGTPITTATNFVFKLFTASSGGTELYSTGTCSITPDTDGVFNTQIGSTCGAAIASSVFTENAGVWLEVTVVAETLAPRQQIATVAYALNSETLQGFPLSSTISAIRNTIVPMNQYGEIIVGEQSPRLTGVSGTFQISAPALSIITATGTNGNIAIAPDGTGQVNLTGNTTSTNFFNVSNAQLTTGSLITGTVANGNTGFKLLDLLSGASPTSKFSVTDTGLTTIGADLYLNSGLSTFGTAVTDDTVEATKFCTGDGETNCATDFSSYATGTNYWTRSAGNVSPLTLNDTISATTSAAVALTLTQTGAFDAFLVQDAAGDTTPFVIDQSGNVGIGITVPVTKLDVVGQTRTQQLSLSNVDTVYQNEVARPIIYSSGAGGGAYPFLEAGNLIIQSRSDAAPRDMLFVYGDTPTVGMVFDRTGKLGIGDTTPDAPLDVVGDVYISDGLSLYETAVSDGTVEATKFCTGDGETNCVTDFSTFSTGTNYWTRSAGNISPLTLNDTISATTSAAVALTLTQTGAFNALLVEDAAGDTTPFVIDQSGNVGIGTTAPAQALDVLGTAQVSQSYGTDVITDGTFSVGGLPNWTLGTGWADGTGNATKNADGTGTLSQALTLSSSRWYKLIYTINSVSGGSITPSLSSSNTAATARSTTGTFTEYLHSGATSNTLRFTPSVTGVRAVIDNVSLQLESANYLSWQQAGKTYTFRNDMTGYKNWAGIFYDGTLTSLLTSSMQASNYYLSGGGMYGTYSAAEYARTGTYWTAAISSSSNVIKGWFEKLRVNTTSTDTDLEINNATGGKLRLTYNDFDGSAATYSDQSIDSSGNLTIDNTGTKTIIADDLQVTGGDILDSNGNESIRFGTTASAVNEVTLTNAATGGIVTLAATGGDTDIALSIDSKGADALNLNGTATGDVNIAGGYGDTGCTITNSNGNLSCNGTITGTFAGTIPWSEIDVPIANLSLAHAGYTTAFTFNSVTTADAFALSSSSLTTGTVMDLSSTSTAGGASGLSKVLDIARSGTNANASHTAYGLYSAVTNTGTTSTNVGGYFSASGATNNYGLIVENGNVGIGTTSPNQLLHLQGASGLDGATPITLKLNTTSAGTWTNEAVMSQILFSTDDQSGTAGTRGAIKVYADDTSGADTGISFWTTTNGATGIQEQMRIDHLGNVGIGTTSPGAKLDVSSGLLSIVIGADSNVSTRTDATDKYARLGVYHYTNTEEPVGLLYSVSDATNNWVAIGGGSSALNTATKLQFFTAANNTTVSGTERMRIGANGGVSIGSTYVGTDPGTGSMIISGNVGIGTTAPASTSILDLTSTTKGFLAPRMTTTQRDAITTPATGLFLYNTTTNAYNVYNGTTWGAVGGGGGAWSDLTVPTANLTLAMDADTTTFNWDTLTSGTGLTLAANTTGAASNTQKILALSTAGANATSTQTTYGLYTTNTHTGTASTNVGGYFSASGGTNNYGLIVENGSVGIGVTAPTQKLEVNGYIVGQRFVDSASSSFYLDAAEAGINLALASGSLTSAIADSATAIGFTFNTTNTLSTQGSKLLSLQNNGTEKMYLDKDGNLYVAGTLLSGNGTSMLLTNKSGGVVANRALVILDSSNNSSFTTTTTPYNKAGFGVVVGVGLGVTNDADGDGACDANDICMVAYGGEVEVTVKNASTAVKGDYLFTSDTAGSAVASAKQYDGLVGAVSNTAGAGSGYVKMIFKVQPQVTAAAAIDKTTKHNEYWLYADQYQAVGEGANTDTNLLQRGLAFDTFTDSTKTDSANTTASFDTNTQKTGLIGGQTMSTATTDNDGQTYLGSNTVNDTYYYDRTRDSSPEVQVELGIDPNWYNGVTLSVATTSAQFSQNSVITQKNPNLSPTYNGSLIKVTGTDATPRTIYITIKSPTTFDWTNYQGDAATGVTITPGTAQTLTGTGVSATFTNARYNTGDVFKIASWFIEAESATRGAKQQFPEKANIIATASSVDIIDADTQKLWMRFSQGTSYAIGVDANNDPSSANMLNGKAYISTNGSAATGLYTLDFTHDAVFKQNATDWRLSDTALYGRNAANTYNVINTSNILVNITANDVSAAVIPNQPTQEVTVSGWGYLPINTPTETVNLPYKFNNIPNVVITAAGRSATAPVNFASCTVSDATVTITVNAVTTSTFIARSWYSDPGQYECYSWTATGQVSPRQFVAVATGATGADGGTTVINETDGTKADYEVGTQHANVIWSNKVALLNDGSLYSAYNNDTANTSSVVHRYIHNSLTETSINQYWNGYYNVGVVAGQGVAITGTSATNAIKSLDATAKTSSINNTSNTIYVGTSSGVSVIQENQGKSNLSDGTVESTGSVKYYTKDYISEEMVGDIRGMWPLNYDNTSADNEDVSINADNLTATNIDSNDAVTGVRGKAVDLDGSTEYLSNTAVSMPTTGSWSAWVKYASVPGVNTATGALTFGTGAVGSGGAYGYLGTTGAESAGTGDNLGCAVYNAAWPVASNPETLSANTWYHVTCTLSSDGLKLYVDGQLKSTNTSVTAAGGASTTVVVGRFPNAAPAYFTGTIDEPFVTATALTAGQIKNMYQVGYRALQSHATTLGGPSADGNQQLGFISTGTNTVGDARPDWNNQFMYVGTNSTTLGAVSKIQLNSDTNIKTYNSSANVPTGGALLIDEDTKSLAVGYNLEAVGSATTGVKTMGVDNNATATSGNFIGKTITTAESFTQAYLWAQYTLDASDASNTIQVWASNDGGSNYYQCNLTNTDTSRSPSEYEYFCQFNTPGSSLKTKFVMARGSTKTNTWVSKYGIAWIDSNAVAGSANGSGLFTGTNASVANGSYIDVAHNQNSNDAITQGWINLNGVWKDISTATESGIISNSASVANGSYLEVTHNQNTNDLLTEAWVASGSAYQKIGNLSTAPAEATPSANTVGLWHLNETSGAGAYLLDSSGNGNHGTPTGTTVTTGPDTRFSNARSFNGTSDYVTKASPTGIPTGQGARTFSAWIYPTNVNPGGTIIAQNASSAQSFILQISVDTGTTYLFTDGANANNNITISGAEIPLANQWSHIVFKFDGSSTWTYYLNGVQTKTGTFGTTINTNASYENLYIGRRGSGTYWPGKIDEVQISNTALTLGQIQQQYLDGIAKYVVTQPSNNVVRLYNYSGYQQNLKLNVSTQAFQVQQVDANTARLYNYSGATQNLRLDVITGGLGRNAGTVSLAPAAADVDSAASTNSIWINKTGSGGNLLKLQTGGADMTLINNLGDITGGITTLDGSTTANGAGTSSTTLILTSATNFNVGNYVKLSSTDCVTGVNVCYAKITNIATNTLTISPALTWANSSAVVEVHVPELGGIDTSQALANRYGRGYFVDGIVTGNGSSYFTDNLVNFGGGSKIQDVAGKLQLQAGGTGTGSTGTGSIYFLNSSGITKARLDTSEAFSATGGTIATASGYTTHTFTSGTANFTPNGARNVEYLVVGGGGGGGMLGGGGGGGGYQTGTGFAVTAQAYTITVGGGGGGSTSASNKGTNGSDSIFSTITSKGGGGGGSNTNTAGAGGGSGGGGGNAGIVGGAGTSGQGSNGGLNTFGNASAGSGGGGAGAIGQNATNGAINPGVAGDGGAGIASSISGSSVYYSGGGGGGGRYDTGGSANGGAGGIGGGGTGGNSTGSPAAVAGTTNTGGGGGGGGYNGTLQAGAAGGSGIVIIRYSTNYGTLYLGSTNTSSSDLAEYYVAGDSSIAAGDVVSISNTKVLDDGGEELTNQGVMRKATKPYDSKLIGIISTNPGVLMGSIDGDTGAADKRMLALSGRVPVKIDPDSEPIEVGDFLTSSQKPGLAMKATKAGYTVGKALESWNSGGPEKIEVFVNLGYHDPDLALTDTGDIVLTGDSPETYAVTTPTGITSRIGAFASATVAKLKAGVIQTNLISPISPAGADGEGGSPITITAPVVITPTLQGSSLSDMPALTVDGEIDAATISARLAILTNIQADTITAKNIVADTISANHIEGLDAKIASLSAGLTDSEVESITDRIKNRLALLTGNEATAQDIPVPPESTPSALLTTNYQLPTTASDSASLSSLDIDFATINNYLAVIGQAVITDLDVTGHLYATNINSKTGILALGDSTLIVDATGQVMVNGDLTVSGSITASELNLERLNVYDEAGSIVASIDASGSANLAALTTQMITIASSSEAQTSQSGATPSALASLIGTATSNATAGQSILVSPNTELVIESPYITPNSLVYLTPTTNTENKVLFVKSKESCLTPTTNYQLPTTNCKASFTVAIDATATSDISFNWWVIQLGVPPN